VKLEPTRTQPLTDKLDAVEKKSNTENLPPILMDPPRIDKLLPKAIFPRTLMFPPVMKLPERLIALPILVTHRRLREEPKQRDEKVDKVEDVVILLRTLKLEPKLTKDKVESLDPARTHCRRERLLPN
jgi:hypothetical protein